MTFDIYKDNSDGSKEFERLFLSATFGCELMGKLGMPSIDGTPAMKAYMRTNGLSSTNWTLYVLKEL
jgi:hypothetical protein